MSDHLDEEARRRWMDEVWPQILVQFSTKRATVQLAKARLHALVVLSILILALKYYDSEGSLQTVEVYRYYCHNKLCEKGSFTHLPPGLVRCSRYRTEMHLLGVQMYAWGYSTLRAEPQDEAYRRRGTALVANMPGAQAPS